MCTAPAVLNPRNARELQNGGVLLIRALRKLQARNSSRPIQRPTEPTPVRFGARRVTQAEKTETGLSRNQKLPQGWKADILLELLQENGTIKKRMNKIENKLAES